MFNAPGWDDFGKPGPKAAPHKTVAPLPEDPPAGLTQAEATHWKELREQLRALGNTCVADAGLVRVLAKQLARLDQVQALLGAQGVVRPDGSPNPLLKSVESLERTVAVNLNSLDLTPVRRRGADMVVAGVEGKGTLPRESWAWDPGLMENLEAEDVQALEGYRFPLEILDGHKVPPAARLGNKYRVSYLCYLADDMERNDPAMGTLAKLLGGGLPGEYNPFQENPTPDIVSWIGPAWEAVVQGDFSGVREAYETPE
jgi:hypothetical protein